MLKTYYQLKMTQKAPLRIGNGNAGETDNDLLLDGRGLPFIPGSALAGVLREITSQKYDQLNQKEGEGLTVAEKIFGFVGKDGLAEASKVLVNDAVLDSCTDVSDIEISVRDGVGLDDWGMAVKGAKYNYQIVETDGVYTAVIESDLGDGKLAECLETVLHFAVTEGLKFGAGSTRGYGLMCVGIRKKVFNLLRETESWLNFCPYDENAFADAEPLTRKNCRFGITDIKIGFKIDGAIIIRVNEADYKILSDGTNPDSVTLKNKNRKPVIPGTSWAGSFRHHMRALYQQVNAGALEEEIDAIDLLFGKHSNGGEHTKSILCFSESEITGGYPCTSMRTSIDRFTAAPANTALFTTQIWKEGTGEVLISYEQEKMGTEYRQLLASAIMDLSLGLLTVGGEAGLGRGRIKITSILVNGNDRMGAVENYDVQRLLEE